MHILIGQPKPFRPIGNEALSQKEAAMKGRIRNNQSAKARSPTRRISSITDFQERLDTVVDVIDDVSDHDSDIRCRSWDARYEVFYRLILLRL